MNAEDAVEVLRAEFVQLGYAFFDHGPYDLNLVGLRNAENRANEFDDTFLALFQDAEGWQYRQWPFTSDPGRPWLAHPKRPEGCGILVPGQYRGAWTLGLHREGRALVQSRAVRVWRDNNLDSVADYGGPVHEGSFGINIHRAGIASTRVENWSAGCQVFKRIADHDALLELCERQVMRGRGWDRFSYTLIHLADAPNLRSLALF